MRSVFLGSPAAAVPALAALVSISDVDLVVSQPDKGRGRGRSVTATAVKAAASDWGIPVVEPLGSEDLAAELAGRDLDVAVVVAYGRLLSREVLGIPRVGVVNVHFSLLPRWRGAAPVERAILAGDELTGISLMLLDEGLDTGPVIAISETEIGEHENAGHLTARLAWMGAGLLEDVLPDFISGRRTPAAQISAGVTLAPKVGVEEARLDPMLPASQLQRAVRAFNPRPGSWLSIDQQRMKVLEVAGAEVEVPPGRVEFAARRPFLGTAEGVLELLRVQPEGKRAMDGAEWAAGRRNEPGTVDPV